MRDTKNANAKRHRAMKGLWNRALSLTNAELDSQVHSGLIAAMREPKPMTDEELKKAKDAGLTLKDHYVG